MKTLHCESVTLQKVRGRIFGIHLWLIVTSFVIPVFAEVIEPLTTLKENYSNKKLIESSNQFGEIRNMRHRLQVHSSTSFFTKLGPLLADENLAMKLSMPKLNNQSELESDSKDNELEESTIQKEIKRLNRQKNIAIAQFSIGILAVTSSYLLLVYSDPGEFDPYTILSELGLFFGGVYLISMGTVFYFYSRYEINQLKKNSGISLNQNAQICLTLNGGKIVYNF